MLSLQSFHSYIKQSSWIFFVLIVLTSTILYAQSSPVVLENDYFKYAIGSDGKNLNFIDKRAGIDYYDHSKGTSFARIKIGDKEYPASSVAYDGKQIKADFARSGITVVFNTTALKNNIELEVVSVTGGKIESLVFIDLPLTLKGLPDDPFAACILSFNLFTRVEQLPALMTDLTATCYERFGLKGAKIAIIGVPQAEILPTIKEIVDKFEDVPRSHVGGAWAREIPTSYSSYLFNTGTLTMETIDDWISTVKSLGFNQIDNHGGRRFFRFGDFELNREKWPNGWDDYKKIVQKLHDAGIGSIFHTYAFFIDKTAKYVTPIPSKDLGALRIFTLSEPLNEGATEIPVDESTSDVSTITGFFQRNSVTLHIDDELITFSGITKQSPYKFTGCVRGACGTKVSSHAKGTKARHLKECFGLFAPDPDTELFKEIARKHAEIVDYCGFDGMYLDAIDGADILGGGKYAWYYGTKFVFEIMKNLKKPVGMEYSSMGHHWWHYRSRWQAWDYPNRGQKKFIDLHVDHVNRGLLVPLHLGWWNFQTWNPPHIEPSYPDVIEYVGCKLIGLNAGLAMTGAVNRESLRKIPAYQRLVSMVKQYEDLRHANYFDESIKKKLREPGKDFTLFQDTNGKWRFRPLQYDKHRVEGLDRQGDTWKTNNPFGNQPARFRIEALMSAGSYDDPKNVTLIDFANQNEFSETMTAKGVLFGLQPSQDQIQAAKISGCLNAMNSGGVAQNGAWAMAQKTFEPWLNLKGSEALGVWIFGDGQGEIINIRIKCPEHIAYGSIADHYVKVDFTGWRYFELIETESARHEDYTWPEGQGLYNIYRENVDFKAIETVSIWYNNLPADKKVKCYLSPVKGLPMIPITITNPVVSVDGKTIVFPVEMKSGDYLEFNSMSDCKLYGPNGELLATVRPTGDVPILRNGINNTVFSCDGKSKTSIRAYVTVISQDEPL